jgi:uncharacterized membrane protein YhhN
MNSIKPALYLLPILLVTVTLLIRAEFRGQRRQIYILKPVSTLLVIAIALLSLLEPGWNRTYTLGVLLGLLFSLGGDIALMFMDNRRAFLLGLASFLVAHLIYTLVFTLFGQPSSWDWFSAVLLLAAGAFIFRLLYPNLDSMKAPVIVYILVISLMVHQALTAFASPLFSPAQAWMVVIGALLFYFSDLVLALNRFCFPFKYHRMSLSLYYGGQMLIALAASCFLK